LSFRLRCDQQQLPAREIQSSLGAKSGDVLASAFMTKEKSVDVTQVAASMAMQVMRQQSSGGVAANTPQRGAVALVEAEVASAPAPVSANGMVGRIINSFA
jgi:hypothetical protein